MPSYMARGCVMRSQPKALPEPRRKKLSRPGRRPGNSVSPGLARLFRAAAVEVVHLLLKIAAFEILAEYKQPSAPCLNRLVQIVGQGIALLRCRSQLLAGQRLRIAPFCGIELGAVKPVVLQDQARLAAEGYDGAFAAWGAGQRAVAAKKRGVGHERQRSGRKRAPVNVDDAGDGRIPDSVGVPGPLPQSQPRRTLRRRLVLLGIRLGFAAISGGNLDERHPIAIGACLNVRGD